MLSEERRDHILREVRDSGFVHASDLAERLGVSRATVWRDIDRLARSGAVAKVHGGASAPSGDTAARPLRPAKREFTIGMQVPTSSYYYRSVIEGAREVCESFGARLVVGVSGYTGLDEDREAIRGLVGVGVDGLLLTPGFTDPNSRSGGFGELLAEVACPVVLVERDLAGLGGPDLASITTAREAGVFSAVHFHADQGHRRIGLVVTRNMSRTRARMEQGYREALAELPRVDGVEAPGWEWDSTLSAAEILAAIEEARVTAIVVFGDTLAISLAHEARRQGLSVPRDLSIISYDDEIAADASPPLSAISPNRGAVGQAAARYLLVHLSGGEALGGRRLQIEPGLVIRESTAPPSSQRR